MHKADFFTVLRKHYEKELPLVAYRKPGNANLNVKALLQQDSELYYVKDYSESGFVFAPFDDEKQAILIPLNAAQEKELEPGNREWEVEETELEECSKIDNSTGSKARQKHISLVEKGINALKKDEFKKVVLSRKEELQLNRKDPVLIFHDLLLLYPKAFVYFFYHPRVGCWLGATPEILLEVNRNHFKTMAMAGTQSFKGSLKVEWGKKEKQEQQYVTEYILRILKNSLSGIGKIEKSEIFTSRAGNLLHLRTDIKGELHSGDKNLKSLIMALHPTPAVCGLPKQEAKKFILKEEDYDREFYTGFLGELNLPRRRDRRDTRRNIENRAYTYSQKQTSLFVNLRCMKIEDEKAQLYIGGGITADSDSEAEWLETVHKARTLKRAMLK